jgi:AraC-like DNA-binding protein
MEFPILLDQPVPGQPGAGRRLQFGGAHAQPIAILNGRSDGFEGGSDTPDLSLKWLPEGSAEYRSENRSYRLSGALNLLLNRGQPYRLTAGRGSETFVLFFPRGAADAAWRAHTATADAMPEIPTAAASSPPVLRTSLANLRAAARATTPDGEKLHELSLAVLSEIASVAATRRGQVDRVPAARRTTREELLRRLLRAEAYLSDVGRDATLAGASSAAALSAFHLIRLFRAVYGSTPLAYAATKRLAHAYHALQSSRCPIADIALAAGYESRTAFDRAFIRQFGVTPGSVRVAAA